MLFELTAGLLEIPATNAHEKVEAGHATAHLVFAAALIAVAATGAGVVVPAVAIGAAAGWAGLVLVGELLRGEAAKSHQQLRPAPVCCINC